MITHLIPRVVTTPQGAVIGGSASNLVALIDAQSRRYPYRQGLVTGRKKADPGLSAAVPSDVHLHTVEMRASPVSPRYGVEFSIRTLLAAGKLKNTTLLHGHSGHWQYASATRALAFRLNVPWVHTLYCPVPGTNSASRMFPYLASTAKAIVGMSRNIASSALLAGVPAGKALHIDPCINTAKFRRRGSRGETRARLGLPSEAEVALFVGNDTHAKGFDTLWAAFQTLALGRDQLYLVATFEQKGADGKVRLEPAVPFMDRCRTVGVVSDMNDLMEAADLLVFPFRHTNGPSDYPTAMLEAMAIGTPVVATNVGGISEVVSDGETGLLVPKDNPAALSAAIDHMLSSPETARQMAANAEKLIQERFRPEIVSRQWEDLYESIAAASGVRRYAA